MFLKFDHLFFKHTLYRIYIINILKYLLIRVYTWNRERERDALVYVGIDIFVLVRELVAVVRANGGPSLPGRSALAALIRIFNLVALAERPRMSPYAVHRLLIAHYLAYLLVGMLTIRKHIDLYNSSCVGHISGSDSLMSRDCLHTMTVYDLRSDAHDGCLERRRSGQTLDRKLSLFLFFFSDI